VPAGIIGWNDLCLGPTELDPATLGGDFIVARHGIGPSYQLAVVADDAAMGVNQVVRGADLVPSTPRQILLYHRLGWTVPIFGHVPLVVMPDGRRLAKRDGSIKLATLRAAGVDPRRLVGALGQSLGWAESILPSAPAVWTAPFHPAAVPRTPWVLTGAWLDSLSMR
jgi:glutamyl-tRNA synthetase